MDEDLENKIAQIVGALKSQFSSDNSGENNNNNDDRGNYDYNSGVHNSHNQSSGNFDMPDDTLNMMFKMKKMFDQQNNKEDPTKNLLYAIKPFLKESRQERVGACIKFMGMSQMLKYADFFNEN